MNILHRCSELSNSQYQLSSVPQWIQKKGYDQKVSFYPNIRQSDFRIVHQPDHISYDEYLQAKSLLVELENVLKIKVNYTLISETFKIVNAVVGNPLSKAVFDFKIKAIYGIFKNYPAIIFDEDTCEKLAIASSFFPSAYEIHRVLQQKLDDLYNRKRIFQRIIDDGDRLFTSNVRELNKKDSKSNNLIGQYQLEDRVRINRLHDIFAPIDHLLRLIKVAVENFVPTIESEDCGELLIMQLETYLEQISHPVIHQILQEKIDSIQSAQDQLKELRKIGIASINS